MAGGAVQIDEQIVDEHRRDRGAADGDLGEEHFEALNVEPFGGYGFLVGKGTRDAPIAGMFG
jgi:hypothetical protein